MQLRVQNKYTFHKALKKTGRENTAQEQTKEEIP
jgi:hypothetical protein